MIQYSLQEAYLLADLYQETLPPSTPEMDSIGKISLRDTIDEIIKEKNDIVHVLMEFVGTYNYVVKDSETQMLLYYFLFMIPFYDIFIYSTEEDWKGIIARWRIDIEK